MELNKELLDFLATATNEELEEELQRAKHEIDEALAWGKCVRSELKRRTSTAHEQAERELKECVHKLLEIELEMIKRNTDGD